MERNMKDYENEYMQLPFEPYQVENRREKVIYLMNQYKHNNILEIGCGMEPLFKYFSDYDMMTVIEPCETFFNHAKELSRGKKDIEIINGFLENSIESLSDKKYDYIILSGLLSEVNNPEMMLSSMVMLMKHDTIAHINVPNSYSLHRLLALEMGIINTVEEKSEQSIKLQQNTVFSQESLKKLCNKCGLEVIQQGTYSPKLFTHGQLQAMIDNGVLTESVIHGMYKMEKYFKSYGSECYVQVKLC